MKLIKHISKSLLIISLLYSCSNSKSETLGKEEFINGLISKMTLEEKIGQLNLPSVGDVFTGVSTSSDIAVKIKNGEVGGLFNINGLEKINALQKIVLQESRLKIPLIFGMDVIHGFRTAFPIPLGMAASWNIELIKKSAQIAAEESTLNGISWAFSPMVDIARDPRWGRVAEGAGEDTFLGSAIAKAMVKGYQGDNLKDPKTMLACVKHFALYGASEAGRDYNTVDMSHLRMYNEYFPPYKAAIEAGVGSIMTSFNEIDGIPATGNKWLLTDVLRKEWGFKGMVVSDYTSVNEMTAHGMGDLQQVSALSMNAGLDMDMVGEGYLTTLKKSLSEGKVTLEQIELATKRILTAKYDLGLFENPYNYGEKEEADKKVFSDENRKFSKELAKETFVLLKNYKNILPLSKNKRIALIGPLANNKVNMPGTWSVSAIHSNSVSVLEGFQNKAKSEKYIYYAKGSNLYADPVLETNATVFGKTLDRDDRTPKAMTKEAVSMAYKSDVIVMAIGESAEMSGESSSRTDIGIPDTQIELIKELKEKTKKPIVLVVFGGRPLVLTPIKNIVDAILYVWYPGTEAGNAIAEIIYGDGNPSGKLPMTFPRSVGQIPIYYNHKNTGRPLKNKKGKFQKFTSNYIDERNEPLYPFGYGLSYTEFTYSDFSLDSKELNPDGSITASVTIKNIGNFDGMETAQLYIRDVVGSITRPVKELKGFQKIFLKKGESKKVSFKINEDLLKFYNYELKEVVEKGLFKVNIGGSSDVELVGEFTY